MGGGSLDKQSLGISLLCPEIWLRVLNGEQSQKLSSLEWLAILGPITHRILVKPPDSISSFECHSYPVSQALANVSSTLPKGWFSKLSQGANLESRKRKENHSSTFMHKPRFLRTKRETIVHSQSFHFCAILLYVLLMEMKHRAVTGISRFFL